MILQALHAYYSRKMADPAPARRLAAFGLEAKEILFVIELTRDGRLAGITDMRSGDSKKKVGTQFMVPIGVKRASGIAANLLWDNAEYVLAVPDTKKLAQAGEKGGVAEYRARLREMQQNFIERIERLPQAVQSDEGIQAVLAFLASDAAQAVQRHGAWSDIAGSNPILSFRLVDETGLVCQRAAVAAAGVEQNADNQDHDEETKSAAVVSPFCCLVTGEVGIPERLHTAIKGVWGAQTSGANIVSFNLAAFGSWGKEQGRNAPVGRNAAFAYTTALNHLLDKGSQQRMQVGDASTVFWAQKSEDAAIEDWFTQAFGTETDDPDARTNQLRALFEAIHSGRFDGTRGEGQFYVLGLAPNAARIAVRFWHAAPVAEIGQRIGAWFEDLRIVRGPSDPEYPTLFRLLTSTAVLGKADNISLTLGGDLMRALLRGTPLPATLLQSVVQRCRAEQARKSETGTAVPHVSYHRAALLKACINRLIARQHLDGKEIQVALDPDNSAPAYLYGRLFATYERVQSDAAERDLNRTIRDTYFGSAMSNPASVFPRLIQLNQHHLRDLKRSKPGLHVMRDRLIGEIWGRLPADRAPPQVLPLAERARFALGYYHQRQAFFNPKANAPATIPQTLAEEV